MDEPVAFAIIRRSPSIWVQESDVGRFPHSRNRRGKLKQGCRKIRDLVSAGNLACRAFRQGSEIGQVFGFPFQMCLDRLHINGQSPGCLIFRRADFNAETASRAILWCDLYPVVQPFHPGCRLPAP